MKINLIIFLIFYTFFISAQTASVEKNQFKGNIVIPSIEGEFRITDKTTFDLNSGLTWGYEKRNNQKGEISLFPYIEGQYRFFYNLDKRYREDRNTANNSANYIAFLARAQGGKAWMGKTNFFADYFFFFGPSWGFQRSYKQGLSFSFDLGVLYGFDNVGGKGISPLINIKLGWLLNKKK